jgi:tetratricopeptide (TPR) repeat protein
MPNTSAQFLFQMKRIAGLYIAWLIPAGMLVYAVIENHPYSYYILLRWICCAVFAYSAVSALEMNRVGWTWIFGVLAGLYNPIFRVHLDRNTWVAVNWVTIGTITVAALDLFRKKPISSPEAQKWLRGYNALEAGKKHYAEKRTEQALDCFDTAIECGLGDGTAFSLRGSCLQTLEWHVDAIDDFSKAISLEPQDCNHYFQRAMSKTSAGDHEGFLADIQEAIRLSKTDNALNRIYNTYAQDTGWQSATAMYEGQAALSGNMPDFVRDERIERTKLRGRRKNIPQARVK